MSMPTDARNTDAPGSEAHPGDGREAVEAVRRAAHLYSAADRRMRGRMQRAGDALSPGHVRALFALMREQEATAGWLARTADLNPATVTSLLDQLEARNLVRRRRDDADRRVCWVSLTDEGLSEVAAKEALWKERLLGALADFSDEELTMASRVMERLADVLDLSGSEDSEHVSEDS